MTYLNKEHDNFSDFGSVLGQFITGTTDTLLNETESIKSDTEACVAKIKRKADSCGTCIETASVGDTGSAAIQMLTNEISSTAKAIYNRNGEDATNELAHGFGQLGGKFRDIGLQISNLLTKIVDDAKTAVKEAAKIARKTIRNTRFSDDSELESEEESEDTSSDSEERQKRLNRRGWSGKRKRRALRQLPEINLPKLTEDEKRCASNCPNCSDFLHDDYLQTLRAVCGNSYIDRLVNLDRTAYQVKELATTWAQTSADNRDFLSEIWVDTETSGIAKLVFWRTSNYGTYFPNLHIPVDSWNLDQMYKDIVLYIMNTY